MVQHLCLGLFQLLHKIIDATLQRRRIVCHPGALQASGRCAILSDAKVSSYSQSSLYTSF